MKIIVEELLKETIAPAPNGLRAGGPNLKVLERVAEIANREGLKVYAHEVISSGKQLEQFEDFYYGGGIFWKDVNDAKKHQSLVTSQKVDVSPTRQFYFETTYTLKVYLQ